MRRIIAGVIFLFLLSMSVFCKPKYDLSNEKSFSTQIIEDLHTKKIIFIGENHDDVFPILLMTKYLQDFYNAGMRYIFLESGDDGYLSDTNLAERLKSASEISPPILTSVSCETDSLYCPLARTELQSSNVETFCGCNFKEPSFEIVPPWCVYAWKYELRLMEAEIERINNLHKSDPIKVIWPEHDLQLPKSDDVTEV